MTTSPAGPDLRHARPRAPGARVVTVLPLVAATYLMVSGGPFGLEDLIAGAGYRLSVVILVITPIIWSLPTAMAVGELAAAFPEEGGYYAWVRRALGPFWGVQEAWLSLAASLFDLAIYPALFTRYLAQLWPAASSGAPAFLVGVGLIAACTALNLRGARAATGASVVLGLALLSPFVVLVIRAFWSAPLEGAPAPAAAPPAGGLFAGIAVAMWNYMGWDNASTIAGEVHDPGRTYPRTMLATVAVVTFTYVVPVLAVAHAGLAPGSWTEASWSAAGAQIGGRALANAIAVAGMVSSGGMLAALVMSYARLPLVLSADGYLPAWLNRRDPASGAPVRSLLVCAVLYSACLGLGFTRLVEIDVIIYGASLALEFLALVVLRVREPAAPRPFRVPGGLPGTVLAGLLPMALLAAMLAQGAGEEGARSTVWIVSGALVAVGPVLHFVRRGRVLSPAA